MPIKNMDREKIRKEFESRYDISKENMVNKYETEEKYLVSFMEQQRKIQKNIRTFVDMKAIIYI
jgi:hypothetical protein